VYDKSVRRRRAVLALLVACSLALLTIYFGESPTGGLHAMQRGVLEVVSPIQEGASRALKPFRDLFGWVDDTVSAKNEVHDLRRQLQEQRAAAIANEDAVQQNEELRQLLGLGRDLRLTDQGPVTARVIGRSPTVWYATINIDKGSSSGVREDQPVITGDGLVGTVSAVSPHAAVVTLITDHSVAVSARVNESRVPGMVQAAVGAPGDLVLQYTTSRDVIRPRQTVVTAGTSSRYERLQSLFPAGIPIGRVTRVEDAGTDTQVVHVRPFADMRRLEFVQVLTKPDTRPRA
jgi:rod shape-determining protein MreC